MRKRTGEQRLARAFEGQGQLPVSARQCPWAWPSIEMGLPMACQLVLLESMIASASALAFRHDSPMMRWPLHPGGQ